MRDGGGRGGGRWSGRAPGAARPGRRGDARAEPPCAAAERGRPVFQTLLLVGSLAVRPRRPGVVFVRVSFALVSPLSAELKWLAAWRPCPPLGVRADQETPPRVWGPEVSQPVGGGPGGWGWDEACATEGSFPGTSPGFLKEVGFIRLFSDGFGMKPTGSVHYHEGNEKLLRVSKLFSLPIWGQYVVTRQLIGV